MKSTETSQTTVKEEADKINFIGVKKEVDNFVVGKI